MVRNLLISVSGGRSSAMMARMIQLSDMYSDFKKLYVFANTGEEQEETLIFIENLKKYWGIQVHWIEAVCPMTFGKGIEAIEVNFEKASRKGEPFAAVIDKMNLGEFSGLPNQEAPYCSSRLKTIPITKFAKEYFRDTYTTAIGYRAEDIINKRVSWAEVKKSSNTIYPLLTYFDYPLYQKDIIQFWREQPFDLGIDSRFGNCKLCWKKSERNLIETLKKNPQHAEFYRLQEKKYEKPFFRNHQYVDDLLKKLNNKTQIDLFSSIDDFCICSI